MGYGNCKYHFGNTPTGCQAAETERLEADRTKAEAELRRLIDGKRNALTHLAIPEGLDPNEALLVMLSISAWREMGLRQMLVTRESLYGPDHLGDMRVDVVAEMHREAMTDHARIAKLCADAGLDKRMVEIAEREADMLGLALDAALEAAGVTDPSALDRANAALVKVLRPPAASRAELN